MQLSFFLVPFPKRIWAPQQNATLLFFLFLFLLVKSLLRLLFGNDQEKVREERAKQTRRWRATPHAQQNIGHNPVDIFTTLLLTYTKCNTHKEEESVQQLQREAKRWKQSNCCTSHYSVQTKSNIRYGTEATKKLDKESNKEEERGGRCTSMVTQLGTVQTKRTAQEKLKTPL